MTELTDGLRATEADCAAGRTAPRVSLADIEATIIYEESIIAGDVVNAASRPPEAIDSLSVLTIHLIVLRNGFTVIGKSAPASPENFSAELGAKLAREDAIRQCWPLMGYALRDRMHREAARIRGEQA